MSIEDSQFDDQLIINLGKHKPVLNFFCIKYPILFLLPREKEIVFIINRWSDPKDNIV